MKNHPPAVGQYRIITGLVLLTLSVTVLFAVFPSFLSRIIESSQEMKILAEEVRERKRDYNRTREESESLNHEIVDMNSRINALVKQSEQITGRINEYLDTSIRNRTARDSIKSLFGEQVDVIEPRIDSLQLLFTAKTDEMVGKLKLLYQKEKDMNISLHQQDLKTRLKEVYTFTVVIGLPLMLFMLMYGLFLLISGFRILRAHS